MSSQVLTVLQKSTLKTTSGKSSTITFCIIWSNFCDGTSIWNKKYSLYFTNKWKLSGFIAIKSLLQPSALDMITI